jgi:hypothetical protein
MWGSTARESQPRGRCSLKLLPAANKRLNYILNESFGQLWNQQREAAM